MPARHVLKTRSPHFSFMLLKDYWFKEFYLGLKVAASLDRTESFIKTIGFKQTGVNVVWNVSYINVFIPVGWFRQCATASAAMGVKSLRPTWFEDETVAKTAAEPMHGLRLIIQRATLSELDELLQAYDMKRNLVELNYEAVWTRRTWKCEYMVLDRRASSRCSLGLDRCAPLFGTIVHWMILL